MASATLLNFGHVCQIKQDQICHNFAMMAMVVNAAFALKFPQLKKTKENLSQGIYKRNKVDVKLTFVRALPKCRANVRYFYTGGKIVINLNKNTKFPVRTKGRTKSV